MKVKLLSLCTFPNINYIAGLNSLYYYLITNNSHWSGVVHVIRVLSPQHPIKSVHVILTGILLFFNIGTLLSVCTCIIGIHGVGNYCPFFLCPHISWAHDIQDPVWALVIIISL